MEDRCALWFWRCGRQGKHKGRGYFLIGRRQDYHPPRYDIERFGPATFHAITPGERGYGGRRTRYLSRVLRDVRDGVVSVAPAEGEYGVAIAQDGRSVDDVRALQLRLLSSPWTSKEHEPEAARPGKPEIAKKGRSEAGTRAVVDDQRRWDMVWNMQFESLYSASDDVFRLARDTHAEFNDDGPFYGNALYPSLQMLSDALGVALAFPDADACGPATSGGTESIILR